MHHQRLFLSCHPATSEKTFRATHYAHIYTAAASFSSIEQLPHLDPKRLGDPVNDGDGGVPGTSFDITDVGAMDIGLERKLFLRQAFGGTQALEVLTETMTDIHGACCLHMHLISLQTIGDIRT